MEVRVVGFAQLLFRSWCTGIHKTEHHKQHKTKSRTNPQEVLPTKLITHYYFHLIRPSQAKVQRYHDMELANDALDGASVAYDEIKPTLDAMFIQLNESSELASVTLDKYSEWAYHTIEEKADTIFDSNDEIKPALDAMSIQLNTFSELAESAIFDAYEEAADAIFDYIEADVLIDTVRLEEQYLERSKSGFVSGAPLPRYAPNMSSPPKGKANKKLTKGLKASSATETKLNRDVNTPKTKVAALESGEADKKREHEIKVLDMKQAIEQAYKKARLAHQDNNTPKTKVAAHESGEADKKREHERLARQLEVKRKIVAAKEKQLGIRGNPGRKDVTRGLKKTRRPMINKHSAHVASKKKKPIGSSTVKNIPTTALETLEEQLEETREAEEIAPLTTTTKLFIDGAIEGASKILDDASEMAYNACAPPTASTNGGAEEREGVEVASNKKKPIGSSTVKNILTTALETLEEQLEETREAEEIAAPTTTTKLEAVLVEEKAIVDATNDTEAALASRGNEPLTMEFVEERLAKQQKEHEKAMAALEKKLTSGNEVVVEECDGPLSNDAGSNAVNEETTEAPSNVNAETPKTDDEMPTQLNKLSESVSNGLTAVYVSVGEDLSLIDIALSEAAKSLSALIKGEVYYDQENEGEGMEISLDNRVGNSRTVAEI